ncbi:preprotein translocase subunit YajC [Nocardioides mesophilus]|uniref:Preprotein translocase subunit YajC n=1 Tax=Nocardioides mesophilus TaxID=433659 RepID=A0A7G9RA90_9ACTN|nr:preprotein translocase subunit YajC [Nocardioides mesophilus]QNN52515.1 preprotein translocase subunit YajC [Nocardioides mesophilus]
MSGWESLLPFVLIVVVFWFLVARPARRQQQKLAATQAGIAIGSEVMLGSGIYGRVASLDEETLQLEIAPGTQVKVARQAVVRVLEPAPPEYPTSPEQQDQ